MSDVRLQKSQIGSLNDQSELPQTPGLQDKISTLLTVLRDEHVCDFLLGITEFSPLPFLQSTVDSQLSTCLDVSRFMVKPPVYSLSQTLKLQATYIFIPFSATDNYIMGMAVSHIMSNTFKDSDCIEHDERAESKDDIKLWRFYVDLSDGKIVGLSSDKRFTTVELQVGRSASLMQKGTLILDRNNLENGYRSNGRRLTSDTLKRSLRMYMGMELSRACPVCSTTQFCECLSKKLMKAREAKYLATRHQLDLMVFTATGAYGGIRYENHFQNGAFLETEVLKDEILAQPIQNRNLVASTLTRSIREFLYDQNYDPWVRMFMPTVGIEMDALAIEKTSTDCRQLMKELRKKLRIERNRASARRSNLRRQIDLRTRKQELQRLHQRCHELAAKERKLRLENVEMRRLLRELSLL